MVFFQHLCATFLFILIGIVLSSAESCEVTCDTPLGLEHRLIRDSQLNELNAYDGDRLKYGAKFARLNGKTGYRGKQGQATSAWITIDLGKPVVVTAISTQGYGDEHTSEWVTSFKLFYAGNSVGDYKYLKGNNGAQMVFQGNRDRNSIRNNKLPLPVVAWRIMLAPVTWHNNVGLRMELYGCKPGYAFNVWLMAPRVPFTMDFFNSSSESYQNNADPMLSEINANLDRTYGFLSATLMRFSPQKSANMMTYATAEIKINCLPKKEKYLVGKLKALQKNTPDIFYPAFFQFQYTHDCNCPPPKVTIKGLSKLSSSPTLIYRKARPILFLESAVKLSCNHQKKFFVSWQSSILTVEAGEQFSPLMSHSQKISSKSRQREILNARLFTKKRGMTVKVVYIRCRVQVLAVPGAMSYDHGFFKLLTPPLVANIKGKTALVKNKEDIILDGSRSVDPLALRRYRYRFLKFAWYCKKKDEQFPKSDTSYADIPNRNSFPSLSGGCFGFGPGKLSIRNRILRLDTRRMDVGEYVFKLTVSKGTRNSSITYKVTLLPPASVNISCDKCNREINSNERIAFDVNCVGYDCSEKPNYQWRVYQMENSLPKQWVKLENVSSTKTKDGSRFVIESLKNELQRSHREIVTFKVETLLRDKSKSVVANDEALFSVNRGPRLLNNTGGCFVSPSWGIGISTQFFLHCRGWYDEHLPLSYRFVYHAQFSTVIFYSGPEANVSTTLPPGQEADSYNLKLEAIITDARGGESKAELVLKVEPSNNLEDFRKRFKNFTKTAGSLVNNGETDTTAEKALALIQTAEKIFEKQFIVQNKLKDEILASIENIKMKSLPQITKVVAVVASATNQKGMLSKRAREKGIKLLQRSASAMTRKSNVKIEDLKIVSNISSTVLQGIGKIISSSSEENSTESREDTKQAIEITNAIADAIVLLKKVGDPPSVVRSETIDILVYRSDPADISGKFISDRNSGVQLPSKDVLFGKNGSVPYVDFQMVMHSKNPYIWNSASSFVTSNVLDINLKSSSGKMSIENLQQPIGITVAKKKLQVLPTTEPQTMYFAKPSNGLNNLRYHSFNLDSELHTVEFRIVPNLGASLNVYIRSGQRPTTQDFNVTKKIPDYTHCNHTQNNISGCSTDPFTIRITSKMTGKLGIHYLGIQYIMDVSSSFDNTKDARQEVRSLRERRDCEGNSRRRKRSCVGIKDPPTTPAPTPITVIPVYDANTDVNYTLASTVSFCGYWSEEKEKWTTDGCEVGKLSRDGKINCLCNHLSAFGGDFFVAPNPIDFDKVFLEFGRLGETGNYVVLSTVCVLWALYFLGLLIARRTDILDKKKVVMQVLPYEGDCSSTYQYKVSIETGMWFGNGTTADVSIDIYGTKNSSGLIQLTNSETDKYFFSRSSVNTFIISLPYPLGDIYQVKVQHNNGGSDPSWFLKDIMILDMSSDEKCFFVANRWIAVHKHDGKLECTLQDLKKAGKIDFKSAFNSRVSKKLGESHLWISLFSRPPQNPFTRCQRLSCCLSIIFAAMVTNAMFYRFGVPSKDTIHIGSFKISWTEIKIGMQSALIAVPVNILLVLIFKNIKHPDNNSDENNEDVRTESSGVLPRFFLYIAWILCLSIAAVSSAFIVFYSLQWGASTSNQWLKSIMISLVEDTCVIQPVKIVLLAFLLSFILRRPIDHDTVVAAPSRAKRMLVKETTSPSSEELEKSRRLKSKKLRLTLALIEITLFVVFIVLLVIVVYGNRGKSRFNITECLMKTFVEFKKVRDLATFWAWARDRFVQEVYNVTWYNNKAFDGPEGFISNRDMFLVGMPRLRQIRIRPDPVCLDGMTTIEILHFKRCISSYSANKEETSRYNLIGWTPISNASIFHSEFDLENLCPKPWRYRTARELSVLPIGGGASVYYGGGYVADLGYNLGTAQIVLANLHENRWIDNLTVAVLVEFTVFEPRSQLFSSVRLLCERLPTGGMNLLSKFYTIPVYIHKAGSSNVTQVFLPLFMLVVILLFIVELVRICKGRLNYFQEVWNWFSLFQCFGSMATVVIFFFKQKYTTAFVKKIQQNPYETTSSDIMILWYDVETYVISFVIFVTTVKCLRLIRFNRHVCQMTATLKTSGKLLSSYMVSFVILILAFTEIASTCFGSVFLTYSTFIRTVGTLLQQLIGGRLYFTAIRSFDPVLGPIYTFSYFFVANFILINMFIAILNECYATVRCSSDGNFSDAELGDLLLASLKTFKDKTMIKTQLAVKSILRRKSGSYDFSSKRYRCSCMASPANFKRKFAKLKNAFHDKGMRGKNGYYDFKVIEDSSGYCFQVIPTEIILDCGHPDILGISYKPLIPCEEKEGKGCTGMQAEKDLHLKPRTSTPKMVTFDSDSNLSNVHIGRIPIAQKEDPNIGESDYEDENAQLENIKDSLLDIRSCLMSLPSFSSSTNDSAFDNSSGLYWEPCSDSESDVFFENFEAVISPRGTLSKHFF